MDVIPQVSGPVARERDDSALVARMRGGDREAFAQLARRYQDRVFNLCLRMCGNRDDANDLAQETYVRVLQTVDRFRGDSAFYTWLFRIAVNQCLSARRKRRVREAADAGELHASHLRLVPVGGLDEPADPQPTTADDMERNEIHVRVMSAIAGLDEEHRAAVVLRDVEGCDYEEIARILEIAPGTVKSRLHRARHALREKLKDLVDGTR